MKTNSGDLKKEIATTSVMCLTTRNNTERSIAIEEGTNTASILSEVIEILSIQVKRGGCFELWDGQAAKRIAQHRVNLL